MPAKLLNAYSAKRYVIACEGEAVRAKLFQIAFAKSDGSLFVTFPYCTSGPGRVGLVTLNPTLTYPTDLTVGETFPVTSHSVKYSHHPSGRAHFSLSGKVKSSVGKVAVPLNAANGHIFTIMLQGVESFSPMLPTDQGKLNRGVVPFGLNVHPVKALTIVAHLYSQSELARRSNFTNTSPWFIAHSPSGATRLAIALTTPYRHNGEQHFLVLSLAETDRITTDQDVFLTFMGGFDEPCTAYDHSQPTSFLMCIYPAHGTFEQLVRQFGTIDNAV